ncbi:heme-dependent oxidative N-demethylase subunit alpha family protein [Deinococcus misasensis]|uniref:heme-dependent oxidative N-demethylase subunit alpha family protein n=1 Tax=Deinococcus misasensis TaxID=392413 RepID=UPI00054E4122|nr:heme-dependent oxidative N-demethylase subunit alpha family protein [Deinococcus misasensis]
MDLSFLPEPKPPFMVQDTFEIKADVFALGSVVNGKLEQFHFVPDNHFEFYIQEKLQVLQANPHEHRLIQSSDPEGLEDALWQVFETFAREHPQLLEVKGPEVHLRAFGLVLNREHRTIKALNPSALGRQVHDHLARQSGLVWLLDALALTVQEDLVVLREHPEGHHSAEALSVCFPSGWSPAEKLGRNFDFIHGPVAENARLLRSSRNLMQALFHKGPFVRFGWGLSTSGDLNAHPSLPKKPVPHEDIGNGVFLRMERQTTLALPEQGRALFTIRIYMNSLNERLQKDPALRPRLIRLLKSVHPEVIKYKGMQDLLVPVLGHLEMKSE